MGCACGIRGPPDDDEAEGVDAGADRADARIVTAERGEEEACSQHAERGGEAAGIISETAAGGSNTRSCASAQAEALISSANISAVVESQVAKRKASRFSGRLSP